VAKALSKLKVASGSNQSLVQFVDDGITVAGLPVLASDQVDASTLFWGIPKAVVFVQRKYTTVERFPNVQQDGTWIRAVSRLAWPSSTRVAWFAATTPRNPLHHK
jgi:hypothetical protein